MSFTLSDILHEVGQILLTPCLIVLVLFIIASVWQIGTVFIEYIMENRKLKENMTLLLQALIGLGNEDIIVNIQDSNLLTSHKNSIVRFVEQEEVDKDAKMILARTIIQEEDSKLEKNLRITDGIAKLGPMFGLLGTLIPLGPGIVALGQGDTALLSQSMAIAFDTTIAGVICGAICYVISKIRKRWYGEYMNNLEAILEILLIKEDTNA